MSYMTIAGVQCDLHEVIATCYDSESFNLVTEKSAQIFKNPARNESNPHGSLISEINRIANGLDIKIEKKKAKPNDDEKVRNYISELGKKFDEITLRKDSFKDAIQQHENIYKHIKHLAGLEVDFEDMFDCKMIAIRFGRIPTDSLPKFEYYDNKGFVYINFDSDEFWSWGVYFTSKAKKQVIDRIFESLYFERTMIPDYLKGNANDSIKYLEKMLSEEKEKLHKADEELQSLIKNNSKKLSECYAFVRKLAIIYEIKKSAIFIGKTFYISGYVPTRREKAFIRLFDKFPETAVTVQDKDSENEVETQESPPVLLRNNKILKPFESFVKMYGLPSYDGIDPTGYFAISYIVLYGIMFGDLGQGLVIAMLGFLLKNKFGLAPIMMRIGFSSAFFGMIYGSVFGIETIITPFFHHEKVYEFLGYSSPPENIFQIANILLIFALFIGAFLILVTMVVNISISIKRKSWGQAFFSANGVAGFIFYASVIAFAGLQFGMGIKIATPLFVIGCIVLPLVIIFLREPLTKLVSRKAVAVNFLEEEEKQSAGAFIGMGFIEMFEMALTYLSNTMSFLRVGGFILSHAGMMLVVAQFGGMNAPDAKVGVGTIIAYVIGNAVVIFIEGFLVGIQVLRLEFYEIFSRFYITGGREFVPLGNDFEI